MTARMLISVVTWLTLGALGPGLAMGQGASQSHPASGPPATVIQSERHDVSPPLASIPAEPEPQAPVFREIPRQPLPRRGPKSRLPDPVLQSAVGGAAMPSTTQNFEGVGSINGVLPPDTNGAVGPNHYVQWVNVSFAVWDKAGNKLYGPVAGNTLWSGFGGPCQTRNDGDPIVLYDHLADRWLLSQLAFPNFPSGPFYQCIAISTTPDPLGGYHRYQFQISDTKLNDYPKFGIWADAYYMAVNQFTCTALGCSWAGQGVAAFERNKMLAGQPANLVYADLFSVDPNLGGMLPSSLDGPAPPAGTPNHFVQVDDDAWGYSPDQLQVWDFHVDWINPGASTFTKATALLTAAFDSNMCGYSLTCIPQKGTAKKVDALADRLMYRLQFRQFTDHASLVVNHTVDADGADHAGVRWYELRDSGGGWNILQQGTYAPDSNHRWMGSIAMDKDGNIALGYSVSGANTFPSIRYTGRLAGDAPGTLPQGETTLIAGGGSQTYRTGRWGDYSSMSVDPTDGCTFWYTQEYYPATGNSSWHTRIGSFKFASCGAVPPAGADLSIVKIASPGAVVGSPLTYTLDVRNNGPDGATGVTVTDTMPTTVTFQSAQASQGICSGTATVSCALGSMASGGTATVTIGVTPTAAGAISNTASVGGTSSDPNSANNSSSVNTTVAEPPPPSSAPVVSGCVPNNGSRNQQVTVQVGGSNFQSGATANFGDRVTVQSVTFVSASLLTVRVKINPQAPSGPRTVTVTNLDGQSGSLAGCFRVN
jgi:uncharacterized repeat protein (TIGR01451 family)